MRPVGDSGTLIRIIDYRLNISHLLWHEDIRKRVHQIGPNIHLLRTSSWNPQTYLEPLPLFTSMFSAASTLDIVVAADIRIWTPILELRKSQGRLEGILGKLTILRSESRARPPMPKLKASINRQSRLSDDDSLHRLCKLLILESLSWSRT